MSNNTYSHHSPDNNNYSFDKSMMVTLEAYATLQINEICSINLDLIPLPDGPRVFTNQEFEAGWYQLLSDKRVPSHLSWDAMLKLVHYDSRYHQLKKYNNKKQVFNNYKIELQKQERRQIIKAQSDLELLIFTHPSLTSMITYRQAESLLCSCAEWTAVPEEERQKIYRKSVKKMAICEEREAKDLRKRNNRVFLEILAEMPNVTFKTRWFDAQRLLLEDRRFIDDKDLQSIDKEDALICYQEHIQKLEKEREKKKEIDDEKLLSQHRKNREAFHVLLNELHDGGILTASSFWKDLYPTISRDMRFHRMLSQPGSTPLDLFKFYVLELKSRYGHDKKLLREICKEQEFVVEYNTSYEDFLKIIDKDDRSLDLDGGNVQQTYNYMILKAELTERQRKKDEARLLKKVKTNFIQLLKANNVTASSSWSDVCVQLADKPDFQAVLLESDRQNLFNEHLLKRAIEMKDVLTERHLSNDNSLRMDKKNDKLRINMSWISGVKGVNREVLKENVNCPRIMIDIADDSDELSEGELTEEEEIIVVSSDDMSELETEKEKLITLLQD